MAKMVTRFNADEVFEIAIRAEQNGAAFYRKAAALVADETNSTFLKKLAAMEDGHERTFVNMRKELSQSEKEPLVFDPENEGVLYLAAMADLHGGEGSPAVAERLTGKENLDQILRVALELEQKSILYYIGLRDVVPENLGQNRINDIIAEEKKHVVTLSRKLEEITEGH